MDTPMKHRSVVASFFFPPSNNSTKQDRVALFRRSHHPNVRSYQGLLSPISGSVDPAADPTPLAAAIREIHEETGLVAHRDLRLDFFGPTFTFEDEKAWRSWSIHPFGWTLLCDEDEFVAKLSLDWEHQGWEWVVVSDLLEETERRKDCVPLIEESLQRVYYGPRGIFKDDEQMLMGTRSGDAFHRGMADLRGDLVNGARVLATNALICLRDIAEGYNFVKSFWPLETMTIASYHLVHSARPSMNAGIGSAVIVALSELGIYLDITEDKTKILEILDEIISNRQSAMDRLCVSFTDYILASNTDTIHILTLSSSSTIKTALLHLFADIPQSRRINIKISILESRPRCEGASLAASLLRHLTDRTKSSTGSTPNVDITVAPDSHLPFLLTTQSTVGASSGEGSSRCLLLGADRISSSGAVLNKTLSLSAAVLAKTLPVKGPRWQVVVVSDSDKIAGASYSDDFSLGGVSHKLRGEDRVAASAAAAAVEEDELLKSYEAERGSVEDVVGAWSASGVNTEDINLIRQHLVSGQSRLREDGKKDSSEQVQLNIKNVVFEWVPSQYIDTYLTEEGVTDRTEIRRRSEEKGRREKGAFDLMTEQDF